MKDFPTEQWNLKSINNNIIIVAIYAYYVINSSYKCLHLLIVIQYIIHNL